MKILALLTCLALLLPSCESTGGAASAVPLLSAGVTYYTAKTAQKSPQKAAKLSEAAAALDTLSEGVVNKETVLALLGDKLGANDPEMKALITLVGGYFPAGDVALPHQAQLAALAKTVAGAIRAGLPAGIPTSPLPLP